MENFQTTKWSLSTNWTPYESILLALQEFKIHIKHLVIKTIATFKYHINKLRISCNSKNNKRSSTVSSMFKLTNPPADIDPLSLSLG